MMKRATLILSLLLALVTGLVCLNGCSNKELTEKDFVGTWRSTRSTTPIRMLANGEWELTSDDGSALQYGVWQVFDNQIMWSFIMDDVMRHDPNPIVSVGPKEFKLREGNGSVTTFTRLE